MTMLDRMRRHRNWLKWSLALVCLAFVIFYIPDLVGVGPTALVPDTVAVVEGNEIRAEEFRRTYQAQLAAYRQAYGGNMSEALLKQLGVDQQILQQMVDERAALAEAERLGLTVSDEEVAQRIFAIPAFQQNGAFIGTAAYQQVLASQRPPLTTTEFENGIRRALVADKLRQSVTEWLSISDKELEQEYRRQNEKVKLAFVPFSLDSYRPDVQANDQEIQAAFDSRKTEFTIPEKRKIKYVLVDVEALRAKVTVSQADIERAYNDQIEQFSTPEQIRASHILLKTEGKDDAAVKAKAEDLLKQVKGGADFAALARQHSEDDSNKDKGGDLDFFGRGRMVPEFDTAAFGLEPGQVSELVKTQYGYHIIKLTEKKPGTMRPMAEVKDQLTDQIAYQRAQTQAMDLAQKLGQEIKSPADLEGAAARNGLKVEETGFFAQSEPILSLGSAPEVAARAFTLKEGEVSTGIGTARGVVFATLVQKQDPYVPKLEEVKDRVRDTVIREKARDMARQKAAELAAKVKTAGDFDKAVKAERIEPKTTEFLARDASIPEIGPAPQVIEQAFKMATGTTSDVINTDNGAVVLRVVDKAEVTEADFTGAKETFRGQLLSERRNRFFAAYMNKAKQKMKIEVNREAMQRVVG
jgi:peptidyl-prolyl cis-trans isomerase D